MSKQEFLAQLRRGLVGLPQDDIEERLTFYSEIIDDRIEEGLSEEEAVSAVGTIPEIVAVAIEETPLLRIAKERIKPKRRIQVWEIVLLLLGSPIWLSLLVAAIAVIFSLYVSVWSVIVSLWAVFGSLIAVAFGSVAAGIVFICKTDLLAGIAVSGAGVACFGLSIFIFYACRLLTKGLVMLTKYIILRTKGCFIKREEEK